MTWTLRLGKRTAWRLSFRAVADSIRLWQRRRKSRRHLLWLDDRLLRDIGIDRRAALEEARKPFWRG